MTRFTRTSFALLGVLLAAGSALAGSEEGRQARSNGPDMPPSRNVVPSEIRPPEPAATGSPSYHPAPGGRSGWQDVERPLVRPPSP